MKLSNVVKSIGKFRPATLLVVEGFNSTMDPQAETGHFSLLTVPPDKQVK